MARRASPTCRVRRRDARRAAAAYLGVVTSAAGVELAAVSSWAGASEVARLAEGVEPDGVLRRRRAAASGVR